MTSGVRRDENSKDHQTHRKQRTNRQITSKKEMKLINRFLKSEGRKVRRKREKGTTMAETKKHESV